MKVNVTATRCIVENDVELNAGEYNINKFYFTFSPEYLDNYVKKALFVAKDKPPIEMVIANDECNIPNDILKKPGVYMVGVYAYEIDENNELILRYSPEPTHFYVNRGSYIENAETPTEPDPDEFAQYYQAMQDLIATAKPEFKEYIDKNLPTVEVGEVETLPPGSQVTITNSGTDRHPILNFGIPEGKKGDTIDQIEIESDEENYQFKIKIYDNDGKLISESNMVDLPIEIFVKNTDYATENVGGVIKSSSNSGFVVDKNTGKVTGVNTSYSDLSNKDDKYLISKGTLDKYVTGKRLVSRTDYADSTTAGVIKVGTNADVDSNGYLKGNVLTYNQYLERNAENFISKGTLENLLRTRDYLKSSDAESTYSTINETGKTIELDINNSTYAMTITLKDKNGNTLSSDTIDLPLETMVVDAYYDKYSKEIVLTLQSGTSTRFSVADLVSGLQSEITANNKLKSDLVDDTNQVHKFVTSEEKTTWNGKQNAITSSNKLSTSLISGLATVATSGSYNDLTDVPTIPTQVTESTVSGWGFTKNTGTYIKPSTGIPKTDLASGVQTSLGKADTALQSISSSDVTTALGYTPYNSTNPNGYTSNTGTITGVKMNGSTIASSGVADLGTVITEHQDISGKQDKIVAGTNISIASDGKTISATDTTYSNATTTTAGLMSSDDKTKLNGIETGATKNLNYYGTCATAAATQAKVVVCEGFVLEEGATISVLFTNAQTYNGTPTLNVNSTGAKNIRYTAVTNAVRYIWSAGEIIDFTYNGTYWVMHRSALATTSYYGIAKYSDSLTSTSSALGATPKAINTAMTNIISGTPIYSTSSTYAVGDRVRYSNNVWECITAITTAEAWKEAHWQTVAPLQEQIDDKQDTITDSNKLSSDLVSDVNSTNKFITSAERTTWNSKQSLLVSGTNIKTINNESILGSGNITIEGGGTVNTYYLVNILNMTSTSDATYEIVNDLINNNQFVIFDDPDGRSRELFCYVPIKTYYQSDLDIQTFWYIDNQDKYNLVVITHSGTSVTVIRTTYHSIEEAYNLADGKQNALVSGTNIKTINNESILGSGNITIEGGGGTIDTAMSDSSTNAVQNKVIKGYVDDTIEANNIDVQINGTSIVSSNVANILTEGVYGTRNKLLTKGYADTHYVLEETIDDNVGYMYISPIIKDNKDVDFSINAQSNLDSEAYADLNFGVEYDENEGRGNGYFRLALYDAGSIEIDNNGTKITKVITPTNDGDAVNKKYVDDIIGDISSVIDAINGEVI